MSKLATKLTMIWAYIYVVDPVRVPFDNIARQHNSVMSIIKVPCILVATVGLHKTFTAPNVSSKGEELPPTSLLDWSMMIMRRYMGAIKVCSAMSRRIIRDHIR